MVKTVTVHWYIQIILKVKAPPSHAHCAVQAANAFTFIATGLLKNSTECDDTWFVNLLYSGISVYVYVRGGGDGEGKGKYM